MDMEYIKTMKHAPTTPQLRQNNGRIMDMLSFYLNLGADTVTLAALDEVCENLGCDRQRAYAECLAAVCQVGCDRRERAFLEDYFVPMVHLLDPAPYTNDPYYQTVKFPEKPKRIGKWELTTQTLAPCEAFVCNDFVVNPDGRMLPQIGFFTVPFTYPAVLEGGREWMTLMPNETTTTLPAVQRARGKVLTYGLGLGYFAFMAAEKDEVSSVTVVERSPEAAALFDSFLLPQFPYREKIHVVLDDAFHYAETAMPDAHFDFVFADIWHDVGDGREMYQKMRTYEALSPGTDFSYWLEDTICCYLDADLWP